MTGKWEFSLHTHAPPVWWSLLKRSSNQRDPDEIRSRSSRMNLGIILPGTSLASNASPNGTPKSRRRAGRPVSCRYNYRRRRWQAPGLKVLEHPAPQTARTTTNATRADQSVHFMQPLVGLERVVAEGLQLNELYWHVSAGPDATRPMMANVYIDAYMHKRFMMHRVVCVCVCR